MQRICDFIDFAVGTDIESVQRFEKYTQSRVLAEKLGIFSVAELDYCFASVKCAQHLAVRFCAKEAVYKAFSSLGVENIPKFCEIEILNSASGAPYVNFLNKDFEKFSSRLSLSHSNDCAVAFVVVYC